MYALAKIAGRQYRVEPGEVIKVDKLKSEPGTDYIISDVLMYADGDKHEIGDPFVPYKVTLEVIDHGRNRKVTSYRFSRRGGRRRTIGSKKWFTRVKVKSIDSGA